jgi:hypothetical protein
VRTKNIQARAQTMARVVRVMTRLGGRRFTRASNARWLARRGEVCTGYSTTAPLPTGRLIQKRENMDLSVPVRRGQRKPVGSMGASRWRRARAV